MKPLALRLWHWANAVVVLGLLATVLLRKTFLSWRTNAAVIEEKISAAGGHIEPQLAKAIAQTLRDTMWEWHHLLGLALTALFALRLIVMWRDPSTRPTFVGADWHHKAARLGYLAFYAVAAFMAVSGSLMLFGANLVLEAGVLEPLEEVHELAMWAVAVFAALHVVGVFVAENRDEPGLVSRMISGGGLAPSMPPASVPAPSASAAPSRGSEDKPHP